MQRLHSDKLPDYLKYKAQWQKPPSVATAGGKRKVPAAFQADSEPQLKQTKFIRTIDIVSQSNVDKLITNFVVKGLHPLATVDQQEFKELVTGLCPSATVMARRTLGRRIDDMCKTEMQNVKDRLNEQQYVCTTADVWSTSKKSYMGVTCHWLDSNTLSRQSVALACRRFTGAHTFDRIADMLCEINNDFGLVPKKIVATVSDNGSNFVKAFQEFNVDAVQVGTNDVEGANDGEGNADDDVLDFVHLTDSDITEPTDQSPTLVALPRHVRCASHTLSLVATTDASVALKGPSIFSRLNHAAFGKCSALWNASSRPKSAEIIVEIFGGHLKTPCATRWNSLYDSLTALLEKRSALHSLTTALKLPSFKDVEVAFLEEYQQALAPIAVALDRLQGEKTCYYGELLPTLHKVNNQLNALQSAELCHCMPLVTAITVGFQRRFAAFLHLEPAVNSAILASITHPFFKLRWLPSNMCTPAQQSRLKTLLISAVTSTAGLSSSTEIHYEDDDDYFSFDEPTNSQNSEHDSADNATKYELEVLQYLADKRKDLSVLASFPSIKQIFIQYNTIIPSSAPVERLFSYAGMITRPHRRLLSDTVFEQLLLLKANAAC